MHAHKLIATTAALLLAAPFALPFVSADAEPASSFCPDFMPLPGTVNLGTFVGPIAYSSGWVNPVDGCTYENAFFVWMGSGTHYFVYAFNTLKIDELPPDDPDEEEEE